MNKKIFASASKVPATDTINEAGGAAYMCSDKEALCQLALTNCFNGTFYTSPEKLMEQAKELALKVLKSDPMFVLKLAIYARQEGYMKDMPAFLAAILLRECKNNAALSVAGKKNIRKVLDNMKQIRNCLTVLRSGVLGTKSTGSCAKNALADAITAMPGDRLFYQSTGNSPSMNDVIKMLHPKPVDKAQEALFAYFIGKELSVAQIEMLPLNAQQYIKLCAKQPVEELPHVPFQMLAGLPITEKQWTQLAINSNWMTTRMNLNTFLRHGVFDDKKVVTQIANKLKDADTVRKSKCFPYQLLTAFQNIEEDMPAEIRNALQLAMEIATENVPTYDGDVVICTDVSGSMSSPVTGHRTGSTSKTRCVDVAGLISSAILRRNAEAKVMPFENDVVKCQLNPFDSVMTNANKLASIGGGGTDCSAPVRKLVNDRHYPDLIVYVSDNESWITDHSMSYRCRGTSTMESLMNLKAKNPKLKVVCIDITPNTTTQATGYPWILNIGGFSDQVFTVIDQFIKGNTNLLDAVAKVEV